MPDKDEVLALVPLEHRERFWRSVHKADLDFRELPDYQRGVFSRFKAIRAGCFWSLMVSAAQMEFAGTEVRVRERSNTLTFSFKDHVLIQLKKVDKKGRAKWGRTRRGAAFRMGVRLPGEPETHSAYIGYMMDDDGIKLSRIVMAQGADAKVPAWIHDLADPDQLTLTALSADQPKRVRVRPNPEVEAQRFRKIIDADVRKEQDATESA